MGRTIGKSDLTDILMELVFNEISLNDKPVNEYHAISVLENFVRTCSSLKKKGFDKLCVESNFWNSLYFGNIDINNYLSRISSQTKKSFLRSFIRKPFIADDFTSVADEKFVENDYFFNNNIRVTGLAYAYLLDTISISLSTEVVWENTEIEIVEESNGLRKNLTIKNASKSEHSEYHRCWIEEKKPVQLRMTKIEPANKKINLRDDHGKDILQSFAVKLVKSPYVKSVVNSLPFNPRENSFIRKVFPNGQIEIVLTHTDEGFGMIAQTTGNNLKETIEIGKILEGKYK
jgi:hypothetical protein